MFDAVCRSVTAAGIAAAVALPVLFGCADPVTPLDDDAGAGVQIQSPAEPPPAFTVVDGALFVSDFDRNTPIRRLADESFTMFMLWVRDRGLLTIWAEPIGISEEVGTFDENGLEVACDGLKVTLTTRVGHVLSDKAPRAAHAVYWPGFKMLEGVAGGPPDMVIGLADEFWQIPFFDQHHDGPGSCGASR